MSEYKTPYDAELERMESMRQSDLIKRAMERSDLRREGYLRALQDMAAEREAVQRLVDAAGKVWNAHPNNPDETLMELQRAFQDYWQAVRKAQDERSTS